LQSRAELRVLDARLEAAQRQITAIKSERLPALSILGDYGGAGGTASRLLGTYSWSVQLSAPLFDGLRRESRTAAAKSAECGMNVRRRDVAEQVVLEVRRALIGLASAGEETAASEERLRLADRELAYALDRFRAGTSDNAAVITALREVNAARIAWVDACAGLQTTRVELARATGGATQMP
jgi:outer membrane protein